LIVEALSEEDAMIAEMKRMNDEIRHLMSERRALGLQVDVMRAKKKVGGKVVVEKGG